MIYRNGRAVVGFGLGAGDPNNPGKQLDPSGQSYSGNVSYQADQLQAALDSVGCAGCGQDPLNTATLNFKNAILSDPSCTGTACATVTGATVNMQAPSAFGPGTSAALAAVIGKSYAPCTDSSGNCLGGGVPGGGGGKPLTDADCPANQVIDSVTGQCASLCPDDSRPANGVCKPSVQTAGVSSGGGPLVAAGLIVGGAVAAVAYATKRRRHHMHY